MSDDQLLSYPFARPGGFASPAEYVHLRSSAPVCRVNIEGAGTGWLVTRYDDVRVVLSDRRFGLQTPGQAASNNTLFQDPPGHTRLRSLVSRAFTPRYVETLRERIGEIVTQRLDAMASESEPVDLVEALALPLPLTVISELLGVPESDRIRFGKHADAALTVTAVPDEEDMRAAWQDLNAFVASLVDAKRRERGQDLLSTLIAVHDADGDRLSEAELVEMSTMLLFAGYTTTTQAISIGTVRLLTEGTYAALRDDPTLVPGAVEEILRLQSGPSGELMPRIAQQDLELGGASIQAGDPVLAPLEAANHDPAYFPDPERFDVTREPNPHLTFGHGPHHCLGAALARMELQATFAALVTRFPHLRLHTPAEQLTWRTILMDAGPQSVPVTW